VKLAFCSVVVAGFTLLVVALLMPPAHAQISSMSSPDQPPALIRGTCFASTDDQQRHLRVEEVRNGWIRVATAVDKNQNNPFVRVESRWLNGVYFREVTIISGPKACDFQE
jgi:hypothetical protein